MASDLQATVTKTSGGFHVRGTEVIEHGFSFVDGVFDTNNPELAKHYERWGRVLAVTDSNVWDIYGSKMEAYFRHYGVTFKVHQTKIGEKAKEISTFLSLVDSFNDFGLYRKEPVLVVGGGLVTDVAGYACASYRRSSNFIRVPTSLVALIDASVSIKVAVNYKNYKNRLGAYHAPQHTFLDFTFLRTLPKSQIRNGFAELIKISSCTDLNTFGLLDKYCEQLIDTGFGRADNSPPEVLEAAKTLCYDAIHQMLVMESPNLHEIRLDRVIAYGHTWSPLHELIPATPLRHGHAISIDMAFSATLALHRSLLSPTDHTRLLTLFSRAGLSMDHHQFTEEVLERGTAAILKTRDGLLRAAVPSPLGDCVFLNDVDKEEMNIALAKHKEFVKQYPRNGEGIEAYVDASDTGESSGAAASSSLPSSKNDKNIDNETNNAAIYKAAAKAGSLNQANGVNDELKPVTNGTTNGHVNGNGHANGVNGSH